MASVNKVIIVGNLGADPEVRTFDNGSITANISVATSERWTDRYTGEQREQTEWHRIVFFERLAEIVRDYLKKGSSVYVEGQLRTRKWTDNNGVERYITEIRANNLQMLGSRPTSQSTDQVAPQAQKSATTPKPPRQSAPSPLTAMQRPPSTTGNLVTAQNNEVADDDMPF